MKFTLRNANAPAHQAGRPAQIRVPFGPSKPLGLGTAIKRVTSAVGIKPCSPCEERAKALDRKAEIVGRAQSNKGE